MKSAGALPLRRAWDGVEAARRPSLARRINHERRVHVASEWKKRKAHLRFHSSSSCVHRRHRGPDAVLCYPHSNGCSLPFCCSPEKNREGGEGGLAGVRCLIWIMRLKCRRCCVLQSNPRAHKNPERQLFFEKFSVSLNIQLKASHFHFCTC